LIREQCQPLCFTTASETDFIADERVHARWCGKDNKAREDEFLVVSKEIKLKLVFFGRPFFENHGFPWDVCFESDAVQTVLNTAACRRGQAGRQGQAAATFRPRRYAQLERSTQRSGAAAAAFLSLMRRAASTVPHDFPP
jgi:hypothetical protein